MQAPEWPSTGSLPLDPSIQEWQALADVVNTFLHEELAQLGQNPVFTAPPAEVRGEDLYAPTEAMSAEQLMQWIGKLIEPGFNPAHPGFMAYIPGGGLVTSALADWIIKTTNRYGTAHFASPKLAELENRVIRTFAAWVGYDEHAAGVLTTGGSLANFTAVVTARRAKLPENFLSGALYCSDQTHHSVMKAANLAGFSPRNIKIIPSDKQFRILPTELERQINDDLKDGLQPFLVIGSAGTTNTGSIDPLVDLAAISAKHKLWFHVDAAYGGAFIITEQGKQRMQGIHSADSITLDPHKSMFLPYGTGCLLVKDRNALIEAHEMRGDYMPNLDREQAHLDPLSLSVELSREHRGLKIALPLLLHGIGAFTHALAEKLELAQLLYEKLSALTSIDLLNQPQLTTIAFRVNVENYDSEEISRSLMNKINDNGNAYLSGTLLNNQFALRVSILNHRTQLEQIELLVQEIEQFIDYLKEPLNNGD